METKQITIERFNALEFMQEVVSINQSIETQQAIVEFSCREVLQKIHTL